VALCECRVRVSGCGTRTFSGLSICPFVQVKIQTGTLDQFWWPWDRQKYRKSGYSPMLRLLRQIVEIVSPSVFGIWFRFSTLCQFFYRHCALELCACTKWVLCRSSTSVSILHKNWKRWQSKSNSEIRRGHVFHNSVYATWPKGEFVFQFTSLYNRTGSSSFCMVLSRRVSILVLGPMTPIQKKSSKNPVNLNCD
jgi:hypothetical protein